MLLRRIVPAVVVVLVAGALTTAGSAARAG
jgi:hypothetical protein